MGTRKAYLRLFLVLSILLGLAIWLRAFLMDHVFEPIAVLLWMLWRIIVSVDQGTYWTILIVVSVLLMLRLFPPRKKVVRPAYHYQSTTLNRVERWQSLIGNSILGRNESALLRQELEELSQSVLSLSNGSALKERRSIGLPEDVKRNLNRSPSNTDLRTIVLHLCFRLLPFEWFRNWMKRLVPPDTKALEEILHWMEEELEIRNEQ